MYPRGEGHLTLLGEKKKREKKKATDTCPWPCYTVSSHHTWKQPSLQVTVPLAGSQPPAGKRPQQVSARPRTGTKTPTPERTFFLSRSGVEKETGHWHLTFQQWKVTQVSLYFASLYTVRKGMPSKRPGPVLGPPRRAQRAP